MRSEVGHKVRHIANHKVRDVRLLARSANERIDLGYDQLGLSLAEVESDLYSFHTKPSYMIMGEQVNKARSCDYLG